MIHRELEKVYYESEIIKKVTCDFCEKDITGENFFKLEIGYYFVPEKKGTFIDKCYEENSGYAHICESCAKEKLDNMCKPIREYMYDSLI